MHTCCPHDLPCLLCTRSPLALPESQFHPDVKRSRRTHRGRSMTYRQKKEKCRTLGGMVAIYLLNHMQCFQHIILITGLCTVNNLAECICQVLHMVSVCHINNSIILQMQTIIYFRSGRSFISVISIIFCE